MAEKNIIAGFIEQVDEHTEGKACVFRGENKDYEKISCMRYREHEQKKVGLKETLEDIRQDEQASLLKEQQASPLKEPSLQTQEKQYIKEAKSHFPASTSDFEIATELQHYGGKTI